MLFSLYLSVFWELRDKETWKIYNFDPKASEPCLNIDTTNVAYYNLVSRNNTQENKVQYRKYLDLFAYSSASRNEFFIICYLQQANKMCSFLDLLDFSKMQQDKKVCVWKGEACLI